MKQCNYCMSKCNPAKKSPRLMSNLHCNQAITKRVVKFKDCVSKVLMNPGKSPAQDQVIKWFLAHS